MIKGLILGLDCLLILVALSNSENVTDYENSAGVSVPDYEETSTESSSEGQTTEDLQQTLKFATMCETPNHDVGYCIELKKCDQLLAQVKNPKATKFLRASSCGPANEDKRNPKVCCGKFNNFRNVSKHIAEDNKVFPKKCGHQRPIMRGRIFGGKEAVIGEYPWMARIIHKNKYGYKTYGCSGFLIHTKYVGTAAHCVLSKSIKIRGPIYSVALGEHNTETEEDCTKVRAVCAEDVQYSKVEKYIVHPDYNIEDSSHANDIALLYLKKGARLSDFVFPICLPTASSYFTPQKYYLSGWGKTETREYSPVKLKVEIPPYDKNECFEKYSSLNIELKDTQICAGGEKGKDSCTGDSGGPLMASPNGTTWFAAGLVSYGIGCGNEGWPGVYTNVTTYIDWIKSEILANSLKTRDRKISKKHKHRSRNCTIC